MTAAGGGRGRLALGRARAAWPYLVLAGLAYVPMLLSAPGQVGADTKHYLYLDPARWLSRAPYMWDPNVGAGTVTHQNIGYLWPMGPFYWVFETLGIPDWVAQRVWLGSILFLAGAGVLFLLRTLGWPGTGAPRPEPAGAGRSAGPPPAAGAVEGDEVKVGTGATEAPAAGAVEVDAGATATPAAGAVAGGPTRPDPVARGPVAAETSTAGRSAAAHLAATPSAEPPGATSPPARWRPGTAAALVAALAYMLTPYSLEYAARISVILLPWAALPWMVGLAARGLRAGGWRHATLLALVAMTAGSVNATALIYAGVGPVLWLPFAVWGLREVPWRRAVAFAAQTAVVMVLASAWWVAGLATQAGYGLNVLAYTETVEVVARTSLASEVVRGLGNWFFYGRDKLGPWVDAATDYTQRVWVIATSFAVPVLAFAAAFVTRWRYRAYFVALVVVGVVIAVGVHPYDDPPPLGAAYKAFAGASTAGLALRSVGRAVPLVALGLAVLLGAGVEVLRRRAARLGAVAAAAIAVLVVVNIPPLWKGTFFGGNLARPSELPRYWHEAAAHLDGRGDATRILELPGSDFASYRWGNTIDPITPGLVDRPYLARELIPFGSPGSAHLLIALDRRLQEGVLDAEAIAPIARLLAAGDVVLRSDLQFERYRTPRPRPTWALFSSAPGLGRPTTFGPARPSVPVVPMDDEQELATPADAPHPPPVAAFPVDDPLPIVRARRSDRPVLLAGDGEGLVEAAAAGLLDADAPVLYAASFAGDPARLRAALAADAHLLVTDTNRRRARGWGIIRETTGYTERAGERPLVEDPRDARLPVFPGADDDAFTVAEQRGVRSVAATRYGNPVSFTAGDRPALAFDGDIRTAWTVGAFDDVVGERWAVELDGPVRADAVTLVQPLFGPRDRFITRASISLDGGPWRPFSLDDQSRTEAGQVVALGGPRSFRRLEIRVDEINVGRRADYRGNSGVGFAEVHVGDARVDEVLRLPTDLLTAAGSSSARHPLTILLARARGNPAEDFRPEEEPRMARAFSLPTGRSFSLSGTARVSAAARDELVEAALGRPPATDAVAVTATGRLPGFVAGRGAAALDGDQATSWVTPRGQVTGHALDVRAPTAFTVDRLDLQVVADGRHSVPTRLRLDADPTTPGGAPTSMVVDVPSVPDRPGETTVSAVTVPVPTVTTNHLRVTIDAVREVQTVEYFSERPITQPAAVAELGVPGVHVPAAPRDLSDACRSDIVTVDGRPFPVRVVGPTAAAERRDALRVEPCDGDGAVFLGPGEHVVRTADGRDTGIDVDRLVLASAVEGRDVSPSAPVAVGSTRRAPRVTVTDAGRTSYDLDVEIPADGRPFWLVLGQSHNDGWSADAAPAGSGGRHDLGDPVLIDGYANGWLVDPSTLGAQPGDSLDVRLSWTPQRTVWAALALSVATVMAAMAGLGVAAWRRRRRPQQASTSHTSVGDGSPGWPAAVASDGATATVDLFAVPTWAPPVVASDAPVPRRAAAGAAVATLLGAGLVAGPIVAVVTAAAVVLVCRWRHGRAAVAAASVALLVGAGAYLAVQQARYQYPALLEWPTFTERAHGLAWAAVALLAADAVGAALRHRAARSRSTEPPDR